MEEDMSKKLLSTLCTNALALAGFSFTSLAVFLGLYKHNLSSASGIIGFLICATLLFFVSSEIAREGRTVGEYLGCEILYFIATIFLFAGFIYFTFANVVFVSWGIVTVLLLSMTLFLLKLAYSIYIISDRIYSESRN
jgi:hypothetical protein